MKFTALIGKELRLKAKNMFDEPIPCTLNSFFPKYFSYYSYTFNKRVGDRVTRGGEEVKTPVQTSVNKLAVNTNNEQKTPGEI